MAEVNMPNNEDKDIRPVANGYRKKAGLDKKVRNILSADSFAMILDDIWNRYMLPGIKGMFLQSMHGLVDGMFNGAGSGRYYGSRNYYDEPSYRRGGGRDYSGYSRGSYERDRYYDDRMRDDRRYNSQDDIAFRSWIDADRALTEIKDAFERRGWITVSQVNYISKIEDRDRYDQRWGWYDISKVSIYTARDYFGPGKDGYVLDLPKPVYIEEAR